MVLGSDRRSEFNRRQNR